jgi:alpha-methylacyl-CoA racemase
MRAYSSTAYTHMHQGIRRVQADLKTDKGLAKLHKLLATTDVLLTSFRPSALARLGLAWKTLHTSYPQLSLVSIVGDVKAPEIPGHDLTYMAEFDLVSGTDLPPTLFADMGGSLLAVEAVLAAVLQSEATGKGIHTHVGLAQAAHYLALPRSWGLTTPDGLIGGVHAFYQVMPCKDGRVAIAALEPHFASRLAALMGQTLHQSSDVLEEKLKKKARSFMKKHNCKTLAAWAQQHDLPLYVMPD